MKNPSFAIASILLFIADNDYFGWEPKTHNDTELWFTALWVILFALAWVDFRRVTNIEIVNNSGARVETD